LNFGSEIVLTTFALQLLSGIIASVLTFDNFKAHFNNPKPSLTGAVVSTFNGGCFFGAMLGGWFVLFPDADRTIHTRSHRLADKLGRKRTIQVILLCTGLQSIVLKMDTDWSAYWTLGLRHAVRC